MLYILFYCCYLFIYYVVINFILLIKWILQNFYEFQRRETLATNQIVENNKKAGEGSLEENPEVDSVFTTSMDSPECLQILFNCFQTLRKVLRRYMKCRKRLKAHKSKVNHNSKSSVKLSILLLKNLTSMKQKGRKKRKL